MPLEVLNNRTEHTHENEQFRRAVKIIQATFEKFNYTGVLIGNPHNDNYSRFRADAILYYDHGLVIIDFKDYYGTLELPTDTKEFANKPWFNYKSNSGERIVVKAGGSFINPYTQLMYYRKAFSEVVSNNKGLKCIDASHVCIANFFSGPLSMSGNVPRSMPYYKIVDESTLAQFLYDFASNNTFSSEVVDELKRIFPASPWTDSVRVELPKHPAIFLPIEDNPKSAIDEFLQSKTSNVLVLESNDRKTRDSWVAYTRDAALDAEKPQVEIWAHSTRIAKKIEKRSSLLVNSIYSSIYGGKTDLNSNSEQNEETTIETEENQEVVPIRNSDYLEDEAVVIIHEAHLVCRSLNQSDLLRFGTGRLLDDLVAFVFQKGNRKIVFVGDPYSLTYGGYTDTALDKSVLSELFSRQNIQYYREKNSNNIDSGITKLQYLLSNSIERKTFNSLHYTFDSNLVNADEIDKYQMIREWFSEPLLSDPERIILFYSRKDCQTTSLWIKQNCLKNGGTLSKGDLLIVNNNVIVPDDTGFGQPHRLSNGMFLTLESILDSQQFQIVTKNRPIILSFVKIQAKCLSLSGTPSVSIWMLDNYFQTADELSKDEMIAFRIFVNQRLKAERDEYPFIESQEFKQLLLDSRYVALDSVKEKPNVTIIAGNYNLPKEARRTVQTTAEVRKLVSFYYHKYNKNIFLKLREHDGQVNAIMAKYGWAITVHKAVGSAFKEVLLKGLRMEGQGITNEDYFRWLYSAIATTDSAVYLASPRQITPMEHCMFDDAVQPITAVIERRQLTFAPEDVDVELVHYFSNIANVNVQGTLSRLIRQMQKYEFEIEGNAKKSSDYLTKVVFSKKGSGTVRLNIDSKGQKDNYAVSAIRIEQATEANRPMVNDVITSLFIGVVPTFGDFRDSVYSQWEILAKEKGARLGIVESHDYMDVFLFNQGEDKVKFNLWYDAKGFFSKLSIVEKTSSQIVDVLKGILEIGL